MKAKNYNPLLLPQSNTKSLTNKPLQYATDYPKMNKSQSTLQQWSPCNIICKYQHQHNKEMNFKQPFASMFCNIAMSASLPQLNANIHSSDQLNIATIELKRQVSQSSSVIIAFSYLTFLYNLSICQFVNSNSFSIINCSYCNYLKLKMKKTLLMS